MIPTTSGRLPPTSDRASPSERHPTDYLATGTILRQGARSACSALHGRSFQASREVIVIETAIEVDIPCDPTQIDETGMPWAFLDEAAHPERIVEGAIVVTGDADDAVFARVASLTERPSGIKVHLEILPGDPLDYVEAMRRRRMSVVVISTTNRAAPTGFEPVPPP